MISRFFENGRLTLHYLDFPARDKRPTLIFLPGLTANARFISGAISAGLTDHCRVLSLDFRGRGLSDKPVSGYKMSDYVSDVLALMAVENLEHAIICGHSFGGLVGMLLSHTHPNKVSHFIILDSSHLLITERTAQLLKSSLDRLGLRVPSLDIYLRQMQQMTWLNGYWDDDLDAYFREDVTLFEDGTVLPRTPADAIRQTIDHEFDVDWETHVRGIRQPTLLLQAPDPYGAVDAPPILPAAMAQETAEMIPNCTYQVTNGNHITMLFGDHAQTTVRIMADWLNQTTEASDA